MNLTTSQQQFAFEAIESIEEFSVRLARIREALARSEGSTSSLKGNTLVSLEKEENGGTGVFPFSRGEPISLVTGEFRTEIDGIISENINLKSQLSSIQLLISKLKGELRSASDIIKSQEKAYENLEERLRLKEEEVEALEEVCKELKRENEYKAKDLNEQIAALQSVPLP